MTATTAPAAIRPPSHALRRFLDVPFRAQTWRHVLYLLLALPLGGVYLAVLVAGASIGAALAVIAIGLGVLASTVAAWQVMARLERRLARRLLGVEITPPARVAPGPSVWERARRLVRDPVTWKSLVFVLLKLPIGVVAFAALAGLGSVALGLVLAPALVALAPDTFSDWIIDTPADAVPLVPAGLVGVLLVLHLANGLAWLLGLFARVMLGPTTVTLRERVEDLEHARTHIIEGADAERRRLERELHEGAQQRLVALSLTLGLAERRLESDPAAAAPLVAQARADARMAVRELRGLTRGLYPPVLGGHGLGPALAALAACAPVPVRLEGVPQRRLAPPVEVAAYFVVAEALSNVAQHAHARSARVTLALGHRELRVQVADDGVGGADPAAGSGLGGLHDRVDALDGRLSVHSPPGEGTTLVAELPLEQR